MDSETTGVARQLRLALLDDSELVVHGLRTMLEPYAARVSVVSFDAGGSGAPADLVLYEPAARRRAGTGGGTPTRVAPRMVAFGWDCSAQAVSTEMARGAVGFVSKWLPARRLLQDLVHIAGGRTVVDAWSGQREVEQPVAREWHLTHREAEVLALIAAGRSNAQIALHCHLSINSVKSYIRGAYIKIGVGSRSQAVLWAIQHGMLVSEAAPTRAQAELAAPAPGDGSS
ncbi:helix-turn-helix transcriptional regulator [Nocardioides hwasunensis]|uniref:Response regulator transcription factor n=1 Tax=Nocardioides hwasunensis TaxID=397258 RepID=A0ABR8MI14_9ACTN|nr:response regulator transcription factor [Nocardioides hwasunensis]MBD3915701.1 response regulator transcription factor [Nocardioides hwasunensis]